MAERKLTIRMNADTKNLQKGMATASASTKKFGMTLQNSINKLAPGLRKTGIALAGVGAAMTAMSVLAIKAGMDFQKQLANVSTMLDDVSMNLMPAYAEGLREMSKEFGESTETLSKGLYDILSASVAPTKALNVLAVSAKAATAGLTDTGVAADAITTIINSFGMSAEDAGIISDKLFGIVLRGKITFDQLAPSIGTVAATASIAGLDFDELGASIATITRNGIDAAEAMTSIRGVLLAFIKPTDDAKVAAAEFGLELSSNTLRTIGLTGVMDLLKDATAEQLAAIFPNVRGLKAMAATLQDTEGFAKDLDIQINALGLTQVAFEKQTGTLTFVLNQLKQMVKDIFVGLGTELVPIIQKEVIPVLKRAATMAGEFAKSLGKLSPESQKFLLVLGPLLIALGGFLIILPGLASLMISTGTIIAVTIGFIFTPLGLLIALLGVLALVWIFNWKKIAAELRNLWKLDIKPVLEDLWDWLIKIKDWTIMAFKWTIEKVGTAWESIKLFFSDVWKNWLKPTLEWTLKKVGTGWTAFTELLIKVSNWLAKTFSWTLEKAGDGWDWLVGIMQWVKEKAIFTFNWILDKEYAGWKWLEEKLWPWVEKWAMNTLKWMLDLAGDVWKWLKDTLIPWVKDWKEKTFKWTLELTGGAWDKIKEILLWPTKLWTPEIDTGALEKSLGEVTNITNEAKKALEKLIPPKTIKDIDGIEKSFNEVAERIAILTQHLKTNAGVWKALPQITKIATAGMAADVWLFHDEFLKVAKKTPVDFARKFTTEFNGQKPAIQRAILNAIAAKDFEKVLSLMGGDFADAILYGKSPGGLIPGLEEGNEDLQDTLDKMLGSMDAMTKNMSKVFEPIIGIFEVIFKGVVKTIKVFDEEAGAEFENFVNNTFALFKSLFEDVEEEAETTAPKLVSPFKTAYDDMSGLHFKFLEDSRTTWQKFTDWLKEIWKSVWEGIKNYVGDAFTRMGEAATEYFSKLENWLGDTLSSFAKVIEGTKSFGQALLDLAYSIPIFGGILKGVVDIATAFWNWVTGATAAKEAMAGMLEDITEGTEKLSEAFKDVGASLTGSINDAERAIRNLMQTQEELAMNTREKLIKELDNYYDYRVLREMDLTELLELSAKTREELEKGTLESIAETAEEVAEREKDAKVGTLQAIEDAYARESVLIEKKLKMLEIEIKLLMAAALAEQGKLKEAEKLTREANYALAHLLYTQEELNEKVLESRDALRENIPLWKKFGREGTRAADDVRDAFGRTRRQIEDLERSTDSARIGIEDWGREGRKNADKIREGIDNARIGIELWGDEINKIPRRIDFDIVGNLRMPDIPRVGRQYFDIIGQYRAPDIPSFKTGGQTFQTGGITEPGELVLNKPITDWIRRAMSKPGPTGVIPSTGGSNIPSTTQGAGVVVNIPRGAVIVYGDIRTKMDVEELKEELGRDLGEQVGKEILKTVPL